MNYGLSFLLFMCHAAIFSSCCLHGPTNSQYFNPCYFQERKQQWKSQTERTYVDILLQHSEIRKLTYYSHNFLFPSAAEVKHASSPATGN